MKTVSSFIKVLVTIVIIIAIIIAILIITSNINLLNLLKPTYLTKSTNSSRKEHFCQNKLTAFNSVWQDNPIAYQESLDMLQYFNVFCLNHDLDYFLIYGTLLGQVRHQGFIPWDDDMDVMVDRNRFAHFSHLLNNRKYKIVSYNGYYKLFLRKNKPIRGYAWSWPFLDIFTFRRLNDKCYIKGTIKEKVYPDVLFFPLRPAVFENIRVYIPNQSRKLLNKIYGNDWRKTCKSGFWNHHNESSKTDTSLPCSQVSEYLHF